MKKKVPPASAAKVQPFEYYAEWIQKYLTRNREGKLFGAKKSDIGALEKFLEHSIPEDLRAWLLLCGGNVNGFYPVKRHGGWSIADAMGPHWEAKEWIPIASDGCGNPFAISIKPIAGKFPVAFFDVVDFENPDYWVASSLERFLQLFIVINEWGAFESETEPEEDEDPDLDEYQWLFDKKAAFKVDPGLAKLPKKLLPWNCDKNDD